MVTIPDRISTLELSKLWLQKALEQFEVVAADSAETEQTPQAESEEQELS